ncbi:MAG: dihydropteroate synthase [Clostridiales bacterium]|jgi:5-methyltetrahydrofolate--homocysteine methyltransferase|nr:dihydropteroate synthase [Clostridiales bacterium]
MIIIGENLNSSIPRTLKAFQEGDAGFIKSEAASQTKYGASYLDINAGMLPDEAEKLLWAVKLAADSADTGISLDTANTDAVAYVLERVHIDRLLINSVTLEKKRLDGMLPLIKKHNASVIALPISGRSMPKDADERVRGARELMGVLNSEGIENERIFIDALFMAAAADHSSAFETIKAIRRVREEFPDVHITCGLSNVSFGLPKRAYINKAMLSACVTAGLDSAIMDISNTDTRMSLAAALLIAGRDEDAMGYLSAYRQSQI